MSKHVRALRKFTAKWPTVPGSFQLSTSAEVGNFRIPITSVPAICYINTKTLSILLYAMLSHRCELFAARRSNAPNCSCSRLFILLTPPGGRGARVVDPPGGVDYKSTRAQLSVSLLRPGELLATPYGLFLKETSNFHISGTPYRTAS